MSGGLLLNDLVLYSLQVGLLVGLAAFLPGALRLRLPGVRLAYWQLLLVACLALPLVRPWKQPVVAFTFQNGVVAAPALGGVLAPAAPRFTQTDIALAILAVGILVRLGWLAIGFLRLRRYRIHSKPFASDGGWSAHTAWSVEADLRVSEDIASPVTFGLFRPVILLPPAFHELPASAQEAILAHECLHVRRKDWLFTFIEELIRAVLWFHPAIWWLLGEIELAREQTVDRLAVEITNGREEYVDALLAVAGARPALNLAMAPPFLRKRRLKHRVIAIVKDAAMSKQRAVSALAAALCLMAGACWVAAGAFPLVAAPKATLSPAAPARQAAQVESPAPIIRQTAPAPEEQGALRARAKPVTSPIQSSPAPNPQSAEAQPTNAGLNPGVLGGILGSVPGSPAEIPAERPARIRVGGNVQQANVVNRVMPIYPPIARAARIQGHVVLHTVIGTDGTVHELKVVSGHPLLQMAAMDAVRQWVYKPTILNGVPVEVDTEVDVNFTLQQ